MSRDDTRRIEILSIDLTNRCHKQCSFCYNTSHHDGRTEWTADEVVAFATDCIANGVKAISLGGGEPLEHPQIFDIIDALSTRAYLSVTSNGLPLLNPATARAITRSRPDKMHLSLHFPADAAEVERICSQVRWLADAGIKPGVNLLVSAHTVAEARAAYRKLRRDLMPDQIIILPMRFADTPSAADIASVASGEPFQSPACLLGCKAPADFVSVTWDKKVGRCSYAGGKEPLTALTFAAMTEALARASFTPCTLRTP